MSKVSLFTIVIIIFSIIGEKFLGPGIPLIMFVVCIVVLKIKGKEKQIVNFFENRLYISGFYGEKNVYYKDIKSIKISEDKIFLILNDQEKVTHRSRRRYRYDIITYNEVIELENTEEICNKLKNINYSKDTIEEITENILTEPKLSLEDKTYKVADYTILVAAGFFTGMFALLILTCIGLFSGQDMEMWMIILSGIVMIISIVVYYKLFNLGGETIINRYDFFDNCFTIRNNMNLQDYVCINYKNITNIRIERRFPKNLVINYLTQDSNAWAWINKSLSDEEINTILNLVRIGKV